jgi:ComF family protein
MSLSDGFSAFKDALSDLFFPPICSFCSSPDVDSEVRICPNCVESIREIGEPLCQQCGQPLPEDSHDEALFCGQCLIAPPTYDRARYGVKYKGAVQEAIKSLKYGGALHVAGALSHLLTDAFNRHYEPAEFDVILPVPIHRKKLRERGFNQVVVLAEKLSARVGIPLDRSSFVKSVDTPPQASLSRKERLINLRGSFRVARKDAIENKRILLVDDVATTGSTIREAARTIRNAGGARIDALVLAFRSPRDSD